jgi:putative component of membrane protein insertase Oxa1/YidC/SpoIIIJ protein YidD
VWNGVVFATVVLASCRPVGNRTSDADPARRYGIPFRIGTHGVWNGVVFATVVLASCRPVGNRTSRVKKDRSGYQVY